jgi:uncharacterized protein (DUF885 family)
VLSSTSGVQAQLPVTLSEYRLETKKDIEAYLKLLEGVDTYFDSIIDYEKEKIRHGTFMSEDSLDAVVSQIQNLISAGESSFLIGTFHDRISSIKTLTDQEKKQYEDTDRRLILQEVFPAYEKLRDRLQGFRGSNKNKEGGLASIEDGKAYYKALVEQKTGSDKSMKELISMTDENLRRCVIETSKISKQSPKAYNTYTSSNIKTYTGNSPKKMMSSLQKFTNRYYPKPPKVNCEIKYVHSSMEQHSSPAFYMIPAIDDYKNNIIYINKSQSSESNQLFSTIAHEGYPGHLYQNVYYAAKEDAPIRYVLNFPGYSEGWATYVESESFQAVDAGNISEPLRKLNVYGMEFNLALCSRVDLGVHYEGWTKKYTLKFLKGYGVSEDTGTNIFNMIVQDPANYLSYYVGYKEFQELKTYYKKKAGKKYNLKTYHKIVLDAGPCSFDILKKCINENL